MADHALPNGWASSTLGDFLIPVESFDPKVSYDKATYIDISAIDAESKTVQNARSLRVQELPSRARRIVKTGDVLLATVRPYRRSVAIVPELSNPIASSGFCVLRPAAGVHERFLYFLVQSDRYMEGLLPLQRGVSYPAVSESDVKGQQVAIPPAAEQVRIVAKLERLLSDLQIGISETKSALAKSVQLRALLIDHVYSQSFGTADALLESEVRSDDQHDLWPAVSLGDLLISASYGTSIKTSENANGNLVLRIPNVEQGQLNLDSLKYSTQTLDLGPEDALTSGDILVVRTNGSIQLVGRAALVDDRLPENTYFASYLIRLRVDQEVVDPAWIELFFASSEARASIERGAASTSGQHNINLRVLRSLQVPIPSLETQQQILRRFRGVTEKILRQEESMAQTIVHAEAERKRLIEAAISGELVPQKSSEAPAEILIENARHQREAVKKEHTEGAKRRKEKMRNMSSTNERSNLIKLLRQSTEWREAQAIYEDWCASRPRTLSLLEEFYADLALLVSSGVVETRAKRDADGRKLGDQLRVRTGQL